jgi:hypothetical protein
MGDKYWNALCQLLCYSGKILMILYFQQVWNKDITVGFEGFMPM